MTTGQVAGEVSCMGRNWECHRPLPKWTPSTEGGTMSVVTIAEAWPAAGRPFTVAELDRMPDDGPSV